MSKQYQGLTRKRLALACMMATVASGQGHAQTSDLFVEEILVTARKQTESLQDVPLSLTAFDESVIEQLDIKTTSDVIKMSPGLTYNKGIGGQDTRPDIRGMTSLSGRSNVAILVDGVDVTTDALFGTGAGQLVNMGLYDLQRVEIVRGPQSALFGRNAFGGAINYVTKKPSAEFEGSVAGEAASFDTYGLNVGASGPISDQLLYRVNMALNQTGGQYDHPESGDDLGEERNDALSLTLQFLPTDSLEILTRLDAAKQDASHAPVASLAANACNTVGVGVSAGYCGYTANPVTRQTITTPSYLGTLPDVSEEDIRISADDFRGMENELLSLTALIDYEFNDDYTLTSNTSVSNVKGSDDFDLDQLPTTMSIAPLTPAYFAFPWVGIGADGQRGTGNPFSYHQDVEFERAVLFQDFRLTFDAGNSLRWLAGLEYYQEDYDNDNFSRANGDLPRGEGSATGHVRGPVWPFPGPRPPGFSPITIGTLTSFSPYIESRDTTSFGIYGNVDWDFAEDWTASLSARYQEDEYKAEFENVDQKGLAPQLRSPNSPNPMLRGESFIHDDEDFTAFNPRVSLSHYVTENLMMYGSVAKGTKPGGYKFEGGLTPENRQYDQEEVIAYELGWKANWLDDRIVANGALFYMENSDKQASDIQPATQQSPVALDFVNNIAETTSQGLELELAAVLTHGLTLNVAYAYTNTNIEDFVDADHNDFSENELPLTPDHSVLVSLAYNQPITDAMQGFARLDSHYTSERWVDVENEIKLNESTTFDLQAGVTLAQWQVTAFVNNVLDDDTATSGTRFVNFTYAFEPMPVVQLAEKRSAGLRVRYDF